MKELKGHRPAGVARASNPPPRVPRVAPFLATLALLAWGLAPVGPASGRPARIREAMRDDRMSQADYERMERGYYESLLDAGRQLGAPAEAPEPARGRASGREAPSSTPSSRGRSPWPWTTCANSS